MIRRLTRVWLWAVLAGLPLVFYNGFFDITEVKTAWFVVCTALWLLGMAVCAIQFGSRSSPITGAEMSALAFCFVSLLASLSSGFFAVSLLGSEGRWQGTAMFWLYAALWFTLRGVPVKKNDVLLPLAAGMTTSAVLAMLNHLGLDPLRIEAPLGAFDRGRYISTLGNINFAGAFFALTVPAAARALAASESRRGRWLWGVASALGLWGAMAVRSECVVLGLGAGLALLPLTLEDNGALRRFGLMLPAAAALMQLYRLAAAPCGAGFSALTGPLLAPAASGALCLLGAALALSAGRISRIGRFRRAYALMLLGLAIIAAAALTALNTVLSSVPLGSWESWLRFSDGWGTDRVKIWKACLELRGSFGPWERLIGGGCGILPRSDAQHRVFADAVLDAAHCEYLQILINWGSLGLAAYLGWLTLSVREGIRRGGELPLALLPGLAGYAAQAAVNIAQAPGIMLFFVLLAVQRGQSAAGD